MISRPPVPGDVLEWQSLWGGWERWGVVSSVAGDIALCGQRGSIRWRFGPMGCNTAFRIVERVTMADPAFN